MKFRFSWINQWPAVFALGDGFNWVDFTIIHLDVEWKRYAGRYYEATVILLGLGFGIDYYEPLDFTDQHSTFDGGVADGPFESPMERTEEDL